MADTRVGDAGVRLQVPASAEIVLEGHIPPADARIRGIDTEGTGPARAGRFGDHTGYYNEQVWFPVFEIDAHHARCATRSTTPPTPASRPTSRRAGRGAQQVFVPILQKQFPEIVDFLPAARGLFVPMAVVSASQAAYPGHAKRVMFGIWSFLRQFMYTKFIVVTDDDIDIRDWNEVSGPSRRASTRCATYARREHADRLKMGLDATNKVAGRDLARMGSFDPHGCSGRAACGPA